MYYQEIKHVAKNPTLLTAIATFIGSSAFAPFIAVGTVGISGLLAVKTIRKLRAESRDLKEKASYSDESQNEPLISANQAVKSTAAEPLNLTVNPYSENPIEETPIADDEVIKKELIRQAMSELGKRSAAKRRAGYQN